jgi:hypothetical protein
MNNFWRWLWSGTGGDPGWHRITGPVLAFDVLLALVMVALTEAKPSDISRIVLIPISGAFIAFGVAWSGNLQSLILSPEIGRLVEVSRGGLADYLFPFQLGLLLLFFTLGTWAVAALGAFDFVQASEASELGPLEEKRLQRAAQTCLTVLFFVGSVSMRTCWQITRHALILIELTVLIKNKQKP